MRRRIGILLLLICILSACGKQSFELTGKMADTIEYSRQLVNIGVVPEYNPLVCCVSDEFYTFAGYESDSNAEDTVWKIYRKTCDADGEVLPVAEIDDGMVKELISRGDNSELIAAIQTYEDFVFRKYDIDGQMISEVHLEDSFFDWGEYFYSNVFDNNRFVLIYKDLACLFDDDGKRIGTVPISHGLQRNCFLQNGKLYIYQRGERDDKYSLYEVDFVQNQCNMMDFSDSTGYMFYELEDGNVATIKDACICLFNAQNHEFTKIADLDKYRIETSLIRRISGVVEKINVVEYDLVSDDDGIDVVRLCTTDIETENASVKNNADTNSEKYLSDGRRIITLACPEWSKHFDNYVKHHNMYCDEYYVEIVRYDEYLEDYLGKGNKADILYLDAGEVCDFGDSGIIIDLVPYIEECDFLDTNDFIPAAWNICGNGDQIFALTNEVFLECIVSDGTVCDKEGKCDLIEYLKHYDEFLTEKSIGTYSDWDVLMLVEYNMPFFVDEMSRSVKFDSDEFKGLLAAVKEVIEHHPGGENSDARDYVDTQTGFLASPVHMTNRIDATVFACGLTYEGCPQIDMNTKAVIEPGSLLGIFSKSECPKEAFDFISDYSYNYYCDEYDGQGNELIDYGENKTGFLSIYKSKIDENILVSGNKFGYWIGLDERGQYIYSDEEREHIRKLIYNAEPLNPFLDDVFWIVVYDELCSYLYEGKDIDSVCDSMQQRAQIMLDETES